MRCSGVLWRPLGDGRKSNRAPRKCRSRKLVEQQKNTEKTQDVKMNQPVTAQLHVEKFRCILLFCMLVLFSGCATTRLSSNIHNGGSRSHPRTVLLLHGLNSSPEIWNSNIQKMLAKELNALVETFSYPTGFFSNKDMRSDDKLAEELSGFIQEHVPKDNDLVIVSHSNGAIIALLYITKYQETHRANKLVLLGVPLFGSKAADLLNKLPTSVIGIQAQDLKSNSEVLLDLNSKIHRSQKYFPETLVLLGTEDTLAPVPTGAIPYPFATNVKLPFNHMEIRKIDEHHIIFSDICDFLDGKGIASNVTTVDAPSHLIIKIPGISNLFWFKKGFIRKIPYTDQLEQAGMKPFNPPSIASFANSESGLSFADLKAPDSITRESFGANKKIHKLKRKYDRAFSVLKRWDQTLWVYDVEAARASSLKLRGDYRPWGEEFDYMSWDEVQQELRVDGVNSVLQANQFVPDLQGPNKQNTIIQPTALLQDIFRYYRTEGTEKSYIMDEVYPAVERIDGDTFIVRNLPKRLYKVNLSQALKKLLKEQDYDGTTFDIWLGLPFKEINFEVYVHGAGVHMRDIDPNECQVSPESCADSIIRRPPFLPEHLWEAINQKDWAGVKRLVLAGVDVNHYGATGSMIRWESGKSVETPILKAPLHAVIEADQEELAYLLLEKGADPTAVDNNGNNAITLSVYSKLFQLTKAMLSRVNVSSIKMTKGLTLPALMAERGNVELLKVVYPNNIDWDAEIDTVGRKLLHFAASNSDPGPLQFLLSKNPPLPKDPMFFRILMAQGSPEGFDRILSQYSIDPDGIKYDGMSVLEGSACRAKPDFLNVLKAHGVSMGRNDQEKTSLLGWANRCGRRENVEWLTKNGAQAITKLEMSQSVRSTERHGNGH